MSICETNTPRIPIGFIILVLGLRVTSSLALCPSKLIIIKVEIAKNNTPRISRRLSLFFEYFLGMQNQIKNNNNYSKIIKIFIHLFKVPKV